MIGDRVFSLIGPDDPTLCGRGFDDSSPTASATEEGRDVSGDRLRIREHEVVASRSAPPSSPTSSTDVVDYARYLGHSARTITRACQQATGQTAKRVLTDRLALEAKRLLDQAKSHRSEQTNGARGP